MKNKWILLYAVVLLHVVGVNAQAPLGSLFDRLTSSDQAVRQHAQSTYFDTLQNEIIPQIDQELPTLKADLQDKDPYIRQQSVAILGYIALFDKQHDAVVLACLPELLVVANNNEVDEPFHFNEEASVGVLNALSFLPAGPPAEAVPTFLGNLAGKDPRRKQAAVAGLLRVQPPNDQINGQIVAAFHAANDPVTKEALLKAIYGAQNDTVANAASPLLFDADQNVREEALKEVPFAYKTKSLAKTKVENLIDSPLTTSDMKGDAERTLGLLNQTQ